MSSYDPALALFEEFIAEGFQTLQRVVDEDVAENPYMDFKEAKSSSGELTRDDRAALGQALSAFANTYGGVLIYGVKAKSRGSNALNPIPNIVRFERTIADIVGQLLAPPLPMRISRLDDPSKEGHGYLIIHVPLTQTKPFMSLADHRYYIRSGSNSIKAEHPIVRSLFLATALPDARLEVTEGKVYEYSLGSVGYASGERRDFGVSFASTAQVSLRNLGPTPIRNFALAFQDVGGASFSTKGDLFHKQRNTIRSTFGAEEDVAGTLYIASEHVVLYPSTSLEIGSIGAHVDDPRADIGVVLPYSIFLENATIQESLHCVMKGLATFRTRR